METVHIACAYVGAAAVLGVTWSHYKTALTADARAVLQVALFLVWALLCKPDYSTTTVAWLSYASLVVNLVQHPLVTLALALAWSVAAIAIASVQAAFCALALALNGHWLHADWVDDGGAVTGRAGGEAGCEGGPGEKAEGASAEAAPRRRAVQANRT
jgi:hypothetical protein